MIINWTSQLRHVATSKCMTYLPCAKVKMGTFSSSFFYSLSNFSRSSSTALYEEKTIVQYKEQTVTSFTMFCLLPKGFPVTWLPGEEEGYSRDEPLKYTDIRINIMTDALFIIHEYSCSRTDYQVASTSVPCLSFSARQLMCEHLAPSLNYLMIK